LITESNAYSSVCHIGTEGGADTIGNLSFYGNGTSMFYLGGKFKMISATWKVENPNTHYRTKAKVQIWGNGKLIYDGPLQLKGLPVIQVTTDIANVQELSFKVIYQQEESDWGTVRIENIKLMP
jgi:hypothetical protein